MKQAFRTLFTCAAVAIVIATIQLGFQSNATAHNNPQFREDLLLTIPINSNNPVHSETFSIELPDKTVQLIWRVIDVDKPDTIKIALFQDNEALAELVGPEAKSERFKGEGFSLRNNTPDQSKFTVELYAKVLDRSKKKE